uniref:Uncharacterized protein n=1 Tax=Arundo donax TaxID=35708 RepID=A0A0A9EDD6_ARUDO
MTDFISLYQILSIIRVRLQSRHAFRLYLCWIILLSQHKLVLGVLDDGLLLQRANCVYMHVLRAFLLRVTMLYLPDSSMSAMFFSLFLSKNW